MKFLIHNDLAINLAHVRDLVIETTKSKSDTHQGCHYLEHFDFIFQMTDGSKITCSVEADVTITTEVLLKIRERLFVNLMSDKHPGISLIEFVDFYLRNFCNIVE